MPAASASICLHLVGLGTGACSALGHTLVAGLRSGSCQEMLQAAQRVATRIAAAGTCSLAATRWVPRRCGRGNASLSDRRVSAATSQVPDGNAPRERLAPSARSVRLLMGPSGSKSALLNLVSGIDRPTGR